jgi:hypothetical protein
MDGCRGGRLWLLAFVVAATFWAVAACASAATFYWYGESPDCWQTGSNPGAPGKACDYPSGSTISNAITGDLNTTQSGDYCNTYFVTTTVCSNENAVWPLSFKYTSACAGDNPACGIQHYVSLISQTDQPWAAWAGQPSLVISGELTVTKVTSPTNAWAYLCPVFEAGTTNLYLEDCFDRWQGSATQSNLPEPPFASHGYGLHTICAEPEVHGIKSPADQVVTAFAPGVSTPFSTTLAGKTITGGTTGAVHFEVKITTAELENAIAMDNRPVAEGCARGLPPNPSEYRLVGIQDGVEGGGHTQLGAKVSNLRAWTDYTALVPSPTVTEPATEVGDERATLNGSLDPEGIDTKYTFQYGETAAYGSETTAGDAGAGASSVHVSARTATLEAEMTYHYRLVATKISGATSYGIDHTFVTTGRQGVAIAVQGPNNTLDFYENYDNEPWRKAIIGGERSTYGPPALVRFHDRFGSGVQIMAPGPEHSLDYYAKYDGGSWSSSVVAGEGTTYGTPSLVRFDDRYGTGLELFVEGLNHTLDFYANYDGEPSWSKSVVGGEGSTYGQPAAVRFDNRYGTGVELFVTGVNHSLDFYAGYDGEPWSSQMVAGEGAVYGTPSVARFDDRFGTGVELFVEGPNHSLSSYAGYDGEPWSHSSVAPEGTSFGPPSLARFSDRFGTGAEVFVEGVNHSLDGYANYDGAPSWAKSVVAGEGSVYGPPSMTRFSDKWGTGAEMVAEGANHELRFYANYDGAPSWSESIVEGESSTYGVPVMARLHAPVGTLEP